MVGPSKSTAQEREIVRSGAPSGALRRVKVLIVILIGNRVPRHGAEGESHRRVGSATMGPSSQEGRTGFGPDEFCPSPVWGFIPHPRPGSLCEAFVERYQAVATRGLLGLGEFQRGDELHHLRLCHRPLGSRDGLVKADRKVRWKGRKGGPDGRLTSRGRAAGQRQAR